MRRRLNPGHLALALLAMLSWAASARAASIQGRVLHASRPGAAAGLAVHLHGLARDGKAIERETRTDAVGHYRFETLPGHGAYFIAAEFEEVRFSGRLVTLSTVDADRVETVDIEIYDASNDPSSVSVEREQWVVEREAGVYRMRQTVSIRNSAQRVVIELKDKAPMVMAMGAGTATAAGDDVLEDPVAPAPRPAAPAAPTNASAQSEALSALGNLGYGPSEAASAVAEAAGEAPEAETSALIRAALARVSRRNRRGIQRGSGRSAPRFRIGWLRW